MRGRLYVIAAHILGLGLHPENVAALAAALPVVLAGELRRLLR